MRFVLTLLSFMLALNEPARAQHVSIELVLAIDTSTSINDMEYSLQMRGLASALEADEIIHAIQQHKDGVAIAVLQWSGFPNGKVVVDWTVVSSEASIKSLAARIANMPRSNTGNYTAIGSAIDRAVEMIETNVLKGKYRRIDVSGDGRNNSGRNPAFSRDNAVAKGITINGLAILDGDVGLAAYYRANVAGGPGNFVIAAENFHDFERAMKRKLGRELSINLTHHPEIDRQVRHRVQLSSR
ncbi:MAG: DUF1194 domain-containing protein [Anderseniella sp.]